MSTAERLPDVGTVDEFIADATVDALTAALAKHGLARGQTTRRRLDAFYASNERPSKLGFADAAAHSQRPYPRGRATAISRLPANTGRQIAERRSVDRGRNWRDGALISATYRQTSSPQTANMQKIANRGVAAFLVETETMMAVPPNTAYDCEDDKPVSKAGRTSESKKQ